MTFYERFDPAVEADDGKPLHSAIPKDKIRANLIHLMDQGPGHFSCTFLSGDEPPVTTSAFDEDSFLIRWNVELVRPSRRGRRPRWWDIRVYAKVSGGATGIIRVVSAGWHLADDPVVRPHVADETSGITSATGEAKDLVLELDEANMSRASYGIPAGEPPGDYDVMWMAVQGRISAGAGTLKLLAIAGKEKVPG